MRFRPNVDWLDRLVRSAGASGLRLRKLCWANDRVRVGAFVRAVADVSGPGRMLEVPLGWTPSAWMVVIDADTPDGVSRARHVAITAHASHGTPAMVVASGSPGHAHLYLVARTLEEVPTLTKLGRRAGSDRTGQLTRLPGSPSAKPGRAASEIEYLTPGFVEAVNEVAARLGQPRRTKPPRDAATESLRLMWRLLREGSNARTPLYDSGAVDRSHALWQITWHANRAGVPLGRLLALLSDPAHVGGQIYRERVANRGEVSAERWVDGMLKAAAKTLEAHPDSEAGAAAYARRMLDRAIQATLAEPISLNQARTKVVGVAVLLHLRSSARLSLGIGDRDGSVLAGLASRGHGAFGEARRRAYEMGLLEEVVPYLPPWHSIVLGVGEVDMARPMAIRPIRYEDFAYAISHDAATGLTDLERLLLGYLAGVASPMTCGELADALGLASTRSLGGVRKALRRLGHLGVASECADTWSGPNDLASALEVAAHHLRTTGAVEAAQRAHEAERAKRAMKLTEGRGHAADPLDLAEAS